MKHLFRIGTFLILTAFLCVAGIFAVNLYVIQCAKPYLNIAQMDKADAVIVPGAKVIGDTVSWVVKARLDKGYEIYMSGKADKIIVSGDHGTKEYDEVNAMKKYLLDIGVPSEDIFMDHAGFDTYASMYRARDVFCVKSAIVTSQEYHNIRAVYIGRQLGLEVYGASAEDVYINRFRTVREALARVKAFFEAGVLKPEPKYLGEVIPVWGNGNLTNDR